MLVWEVMYAKSHRESAVAITLTDFAVLGEKKKRGKTQKQMKKGRS